MKLTKEVTRRPALAAAGHIGRAKIGNDRDANPGGDHRAFPRLPGHGNPTSQEALQLTLMKDGLAVATDKLGFNSELALLRENRVGVKFSQKKIQARQIGDTGLRGVHRREHCRADGLRIWEVGMPKQLQVQSGDDLSL